MMGMMIKAGASLEISLIQLAEATQMCIKAMIWLLM